MRVNCFATLTVAVFITVLWFVFANPAASDMVIREAEETAAVQGQPLATHYGSTWRKMSRAECATKAVEAMGIKENFISVETDKAGDVFGVTENAACAVWSCPLRDGVEIYVFVAGKDSKEVERLRNSIRTHVCDGPYNPKIPAKIVTKDAKRRSAAPAIHLGTDSRNMSRADFDTTGMLSMERLGLKPSVDPKTFTISGYKADASAVAFYLELKPGTGYLSVISASYSSHLAEYLRNTIRIDIFEKRLPKPWAVILCKYSDKANTEPHPPRYYQEAFSEVGKGMGREYDYFRQVSHGALDMTGTKVFGWYTMKNHSTADVGKLKFPNPGRGTMHDWGLETAKANKIDVSKFHGVIVIFNGNADAGSVGNHRVVFGYPTTEWSPTFNMHEIAHGYDLDHTWSARPDAVYGDQWDIMSAMNCWTTPTKFGGAGPAFNAFNLKKVGGLPDWRISNVPRKVGTTTITLASLHKPEAEGSLMAQIPPVPGSTTSYTVEFRQKHGWDAGFPADTVLLHEVRSNGLCYLLSRLDRFDPASVQVTAGGDFTLPAGKFTVKALSFNDGASNAKVSITINK
ncbi:MAG TPA: hypothetical protein VE988_00835 [Gemmataceae bacterium]|nr:hypothetical protein [Gemmataceae bacterium]